MEATITPDSGFAILGCRFLNIVASVDLNTLAVGPAFAVDQGPKGATFGADSRYVWEVAQGNSTLNKVDWQAQRVVGRLKVGAVLSAPWPSFPAGDTSWISLNPTKTTAYLTGTRSGDLTVVDLASLTITKKVSLGTGTGPFGIATSPDGSTLYVAEFGAGVLATVSTSTWKVTTTSTSGVSPIGVAVTPNGAKVLVTNSDSDTLSIFTFVQQGASGAPGSVAAALEGVWAPLAAVVLLDGLAIGLSAWAFFKRGNGRMGA
jgi:DNA-binding beta-propeller fold protein YncE